MPGCRVEPDAGTSEGEPVGRLVIKDGASPRALVFPDWTGGIFSVVVESPDVPNRLGPPLGTRYARIYSDAAETICVPGVEGSSDACVRYRTGITAVSMF